MLYTGALPCRLAWKKCAKWLPLPCRLQRRHWEDQPSSLLFRWLYTCPLSLVDRWIQRGEWLQVLEGLFWWSH